jgi:ribosomal protein S27E
MVFAVQCPKCRKFMLVEAHDQGKVVACLLCKAGIKIGTASPPSGVKSPPTR